MENLSLILILVGIFSVVGMVFHILIVRNLHLAVLSKPNEVQSYLNKSLNFTLWHVSNFVFTLALWLVAVVIVVMSQS